MSELNYIRHYLPEDKAQVLELIRLNTPTYFAPEEEKDLEEYLDKEIEWYYVLEMDQKVVASGGINFDKEKAIGKISWDLVHPAYQGMSLGSQVLNYRLQKLLSMPEIHTITVRTSQVVYRFYEKQGFKLCEIKKDYWAKGFDMYYMEFEQNI